jgi:hypothetical protein
MKGFNDGGRPGWWAL